ncbi:hypothetical protein [Streptomyces sp. NPDC091215]|uniref:hypothetical protein n=1 Tax=Streptomyces sp. NPDC091215 TaxID=3155192 RepID=UPI003430439B
MTTLHRQLDEPGFNDRFDAVIEEVTRVRAELGHPISWSHPFPQTVCTQALYNFIGAERYENVSDQVIRYVLCSFGRPTAPLDPQVAGRILGQPRAKELSAEPPPPTVAELRRRFPRGISGEELLLRATIPAKQADAMVTAGPARRHWHYNPDLKPVLDLLQGLRARPAISELILDRLDFRLELP